MPNDPIKPDLDGIRRTAEDVGELPVPRTIRAQKGEAIEPPGEVPIAGGEPTAPSAWHPEDAGGRPTGETSASREAEFRRSLPRAARTPEQLGSALRRTTPTSKDPQEGRGAGPPFPGERGLEGDRG